MNKKHKNKKGKIPNPVQEDKRSENIENVETSKNEPEILSEIKPAIDIVNPICDKTEVTEENAEDVKSERVPEILSEIINSAIEKKDEETPKKPKRNRGKKKKGKDSDVDDNTEEAFGDSETTEKEEENKSIIAPTENKPEDTTPITPSARKKKNKKKNADQKMDDSNISSEDKISFTELPENEPEVAESKPEIMKTEVSEETKQSKKKNKKNKRNDSERSEKEDVTCTSAFQNILDSTEKDKEIQSGETSHSSESTTTKTDITVLIPEKSVLDILADFALPTEPTTLPPIDSKEVKEDTLLTDNKGKKKHKKDGKKDKITKSDETINPEVQSLPQELTEMPTEESKQDLLKELDAMEKTEEILKPKAKIAKPVDKKRKGKQDNKSDTLPKVSMGSDVKEEITPSSSECITQLQDVPMDDANTNVRQDKTLEIEIKQITLATEVCSNTPEILEYEIESGTSPDFEEFKSIGKKKKKVPKSPKTERDPEQEARNVKEIEVQQEKKQLPSESEASSKEIKKDVLSEEVSQPISLGMILEPTDTKQEPKQDSRLESGRPILFDILLEAKNTPLLKSEDAQEKILLTPEDTAKILVERKETNFPPTEEKLNVEMKSGKKRKKSPKPPSKTETSTHITKQAEIASESEFNKSLEDLSKSSENVDFSNVSKMDDIEISSMKAEESEGSICDTVPDVIYPRSSSQQLPDDNNNTTFIRELFSVEVLSTPPVITETSNIELIKENIESSEIKVRDEKTDLKSKMMEVNQDMEGLRLSIERSLAEFTAMESSEKDIEKQYEETKINTTASSKKEDHTLTQDSSISNIFIRENVIDEPLEKVIMAAAIGDRSKIMSDNQNFVLLSEVSQLDPPVFETKEFSHEKTEEEKICESSKIVMTGELKTEIAKEKMENILKVDTTKEMVGKNIGADDPQKIEEFKERGKKKKKGAKTPFVSQDIMTPSDEITKDANIESESLKKNVPENVTPTKTLAEEKGTDITEYEKLAESQSQEEKQNEPEDVPPIIPAKRTNKGKDKKKKGKQEAISTTATTVQSTPVSSQSQSAQEPKKEEKSDGKSENKTDSNKNKGNNQAKGKQQASEPGTTTESDSFTEVDYEPIENFEDALTSSVDDVNKTFEIIVQESQEQSNPKINVIAPDEEKTPVSPPKNLLGHPDIPVPSSRRDYKKEKDKIPNEIMATVNIKDSEEVERKQSKNTQTTSKIKDLSKLNDNEEFVYKYNFRKVFLQSACHVCKKELSGVRVACNYCNLLFYCSVKHKDEDWPNHQALCFALSTIVHLKDQKHIYGDAKNIIGHDYRLIRMQMIVSCEKVLKRRLVPWEQEALLYPRICAHVPCREWRQSKLSDCQGCGQISYCLDNPDHLPKTHARWCKSYSLYQKLVCYQQTFGRLEPKLPTRVMEDQYQIPEKINEVLADMYEEKLDMSDIQYAALTQLATAPLTAAYCHQAYRNKCATTNGVHKKSTFTIHVVGAELQFEADALNKWEVFFLHLRPDLQDLRVVLINYNLNPSNLPLELLGKIKLCENCRRKRRRVVFSFQDKKTYADYKASDDFVHPDIVCAFNPSIQRSSAYNGKDPWPAATSTILKMKIPFIITAYTMTELHKDCIRIKECSETGYNFTIEPKYNNFASVRPDRNFISDDDMPLLFKNYCFAIICG